MYNEFTKKISSTNTKKHFRLSNKPKASSTFSIELMPNIAELIRFTFFYALEDSVHARDLI